MPSVDRRRQVLCKRTVSESVAVGLGSAGEVVPGGVAQMRATSTVVTTAGEGSTMIPSLAARRMTTSPTTAKVKGVARDRLLRI
jgi:hypothetical protein